MAIMDIYNHARSNSSESMRLNPGMSSHLLSGFLFILTLTPKSLNDL
jgi:hypothetical protein